MRLCSHTLGYKCNLQNYYSEIQRKFLDQLSAITFFVSLGTDRGLQRINHDDFIGSITLVWHHDHKPRITLTIS